MERNAHLAMLLDDDTLKRMATSRVLVIGAGGIGCELLKNLVLSGFLNIEVIDLDTIDVSNLNRQFLFRPQHVGQPKAIVAAEAVKRFNPAVNITAYHANVKEERFGLAYFKTFQLVINALDNVSARRHVNRLCLVADVPLIEAGTEGYLGQAFVIKKGDTECFECLPLPPQKHFPICTIRSTPTMPVHCVVWAKELHKLLFGDRVNSHLYESDVLDKDSSSGPESVYMHIVQALPPVDDATAVRTWAERLFDALFGADIDKRLLIAPDTYKTAICSPRPLYLAAVRSGAVGSDTEAQAAQAAALPDQRLLSLRSAAELWIDTLAGMMTNTASRAVLGSLAFDKDTPADLDFVTASMNLRAYTFGITPQSRFAVKSIAGNIIPAIATTNAIAAGFEVLEAIKIMRGMPIKTACKYTSILRGLGSGNRLFSSANLGAPRPSCMVCGGRATTVTLDTKKMTLKDFVAIVVKGALGFERPFLDNCNSFAFIDEREEDEEDDEYARKMSWLSQPLASLVGGGIRDGTTLIITDHSSHNYTLHCDIIHCDETEFDTNEYPQLFAVSGDKSGKPVGRKAPSSTEAAAANPTASAPAASADDGIVALADDDDEPAAVAPSAKRIRREEEADAEESAGAGAKPSHTAAASATGAACVHASADATVGQPMVAHEGSVLVVDDLGEEDVVVLE